MADYHVEGSQTVAGTTDTTITLERGASKRAKVFDFTSGFTLASPSDNLLSVTAQRFTTDDGTGTARTANPLDPADGAAVTTCLQNHSAEPSAYTANEEIWGPIAQHMRATYRWAASPGKELVIPNTASVGIGWFADHASVTPEHLMSIYFSE